MVKEEKTVKRCSVCLQPTTTDYIFNLSYFESEKKVIRAFCVTICLRQWIDTELDKIHLNELDTLE
jgi:hypothetical protein